ncbi:hypothetical protein P5P86_01900 [Nocardioides sp. BP30]|uniref:hypothetical protein n=1 Tax=Nocardioides sp. BP30 TaxID=3036374 RepID=UPI0024698821|nr:hypothetical protein [Nocardioides sp. BP30]WGL52587.1 hypothetical protein P5P86_01900 [Nocardioides sp. BP30]
MARAVTSTALTLHEAAERLAVTPQRISQLLKQGVLTGPSYGPGRAPANVPRVSLESVAEYERQRPARTSGRAIPNRTILESEVKALRADVDRLTRGSEARERAARQAAMELKAGADSIYERLTARIEENRSLAAQLAAARAELETARGDLSFAAARIDALELRDQSLGNALTSLLVPDSPADMG